MKDLIRDLKVKNPLIIDLKIISNSSCLGLEKLTNHIYKLKITKIAEKGKANYEIIKFFKDNLQPLKVDIEIVSGIFKSYKKIKITLLK